MLVLGFLQNIALQQVSAAIKDDGMPHRKVDCLLGRGSVELPASLAHVVLDLRDMHPKHGVTGNFKNSSKGCAANCAANGVGGANFYRISIKQIYLVFHVCHFLKVQSQRSSGTWTLCRCCTWGETNCLVRVGCITAAQHSTELQPSEAAESFIVCGRFNSKGAWDHEGFTRADLGEQPTVW